MAFLFKRHTGIDAARVRSETIDDRLRRRLGQHSEDECWPWPGGHNRKGYGWIQYEGRGYFAHRIAWESFRGHIPAGMHVCHTCDNPPCCNPAHLFLGTNDDNQRDKMQKGRDRYATGEQQGLSKLTDSAVRDIRRLRADGFSLSSLAAQFGVCESNISQIALGRTWKHVA